MTILQTESLLEGGIPHWRDLLLKKVGVDSRHSEPTQTCQYGFRWGFSRRVRKRTPFCNPRSPEKKKSRKPIFLVPFLGVNFPFSPKLDGPPLLEIQYREGRWGHGVPDNQERHERPARNVRRNTYNHPQTKTAPHPRGGANFFSGCVFFFFFGE